MHVSEVPLLIDTILEFDPTVVITPHVRDLLTALAPVVALGTEDACDPDDPAEVLDEDFLEAALRCAPALPEEIWLWVEGRARVALVDTRPACDLCVAQPASYDAPVSSAEQRWHYLCPDCWVGHSTRQLGWGRGQLLATPDTLPTWVAEMATGRRPAAGRGRGRKAG